MLPVCILLIVVVTLEMIRRDVVKKVFLIIAVLVLAALVPGMAQDIPAYKNTSLSFEVRAADLVSRMTLDEKVHQITIGMLVQPGALFRDYDERRHGPFDLRFKRTMANSLKNLTEKERNRRRYIPSVPIRQEFVPGGVTSNDLVARGEPEGDPRILDDFRELLQRQLGPLAVRVFDARLEGVEMKTLPGVSSYTVKKTVQDIKSLAKKYALAMNDPSLLRQVERLMAAEEMTVQRRKAAMRQKAS